jgi:hypothetical protein
VPALAESQTRVKKLLWSVYYELGAEAVGWCWSWMLGECGKWEEKTAYIALGRWTKKDPKTLPTLIDLLEEAKLRNKEIIDNTTAEPVQRTNPHNSKKETTHGSHG